MVKSPAERKREERERKRRDAWRRPDSSYPYLGEPFYKWLERTEAYGDWSSAEFHFDACGYEPPSFDDDEGPRSLTGEVELTADEDYHPFAGFESSIGRAEAFIEHMGAALHTFCLVVNHYKREQLTARLKELETADISDPAARKEIVEQMIHIRVMLEKLEKIRRLDLPEWNLKGV